MWRGIKFTERTLKGLERRDLILIQCAVKPCLFTAGI